MENKTQFPWNEFDRETFARASSRCGQIYPRSPCVTFFRKWAERDYSVLCGPSNTTNGDEAPLTMKELL